MRKRTIIFGAVILVLCIYTAVASRMVYGLNIYTVSYGIGRVFSLTYIPVGIAAVVALVVFAVLFAKDYPRIKSIVSPKLDALAERIDRSMADSAQRKRAAAMSYVPYGTSQPMQNNQFTQPMQQPVQPMQNVQFTQPVQQPVQPMQNVQFTQPVQQPVQPMQNAQFTQPVQQPVQPQMPETAEQETNDAQANETAQNDAPVAEESENINNADNADSAQNAAADNANESPNTNTAKFCGACGAPITPGQKFCSKCGRQLLMEDGHGN